MERCLFLTKFSLTLHIQKVAVHRIYAQYRDLVDNSRLFRRTVLRIKWGESIGNSGNVSDSPGFKIDLRVVKDTLLVRKKKADKANCEISRIDPDLVKITSDGTKLLIGSKTVLNKLLEEDPEKAKEFSVLVPQLVGNILWNTLRTRENKIRHLCNAPSTGLKNTQIGTVSTVNIIFTEYYCQGLLHQESEYSQGCAFMNGRGSINEKNNIIM
ncbi:hypothetical protein BCV72DRAFT_243024 [Rhizopus microsporus var. microsporus]|uniref:Uncharacterized protein n=1 Tax=Rhizopus microsporus var. microsporus TaxID=86635 RepID=A0A1X0QZN1_RHIZD|nr:hypothetical protein BCV72DRAFT_243024 [Rhizopus microsporus var. microsporus]